MENYSIYSAPEKDKLPLNKLLFEFGIKKFHCVTERNLEQESLSFIIWSKSIRCSGAIFISPNRGGRYISLNTILFINHIQHIYNHQQTGFDNKLEAYNPHLLGGHIAFGADPVGVRVASCLHSIS